MKIKHLNIALITIIILSIIINFNVFLMGGASSLPNIIITIIYMISWPAFIWLSKTNRNSLIFSAIWSLSTLVCAAVTLAVNINDGLDLSFIIPFAMIFITPFYGIEFFFNKQVYLISSIIITIISLTWVVMSFIFLNSKRKKQING